MKQRIFWLCAVCLTAMSATPLAADGPSPSIPELKVLDRFAGTWSGTAEELSQTSKSEITWILDGKFLEQKYEFSDGSKGLIVRGYDSEARDYFMTLFDSRGVSVLLRGLWDENTSTLTLTGLSGDKTVTWTATFIGTDKFESILRFEDRNGQQLGQIKAVHERVR